MAEEEREYLSLWVTSKKKKEYEDIMSIRGKEAVVDEFIKDTKNELRFDLEGLDEDLLIYKGLMVKWTRALQDAFKESTGKKEKLWEEFFNVVPKFSEKVEKLKKDLNPVIAIIDNLEKRLNKFDNWNADKLLNLIEKVSSMSEKDIEIVKLIMDNFEFNKRS